MGSYAIVKASGRQFWIEENRFYDLNKDPLLCPNCGHTFSLDSIMEVFKKSTKDTSPKKSTDEKNSSDWIKWIPRDTYFI